MVIQTCFAGHYAPQLAQLIVQTKTNINLKGIAVSTKGIYFGYLKHNKIWYI